MENRPTRNPPPARHAAPPASVQPRAQWNPARQRIFLAALLETGSVAHAARAAGMSRSSAHRLRQRLAGTAFDRIWDQARAHYARRMADPFMADAPRQPAASAPRQ
ncbi:LysR family transcriptional regulator [Sphingomonas sp. DG1-23]|uniref:LysR family transcriptional regulator n=1 Tax=Sphingomonas sp. DG1-23 TaxID=3068316 RepID=UPI00273ED6B6|nr:LysR family transcriptional regulator [Sphingomonas sp. DG1-23]MDP5279980.1 LysR family transcriptional regulator [Sphingomonas sp. DG1-23]